MYFSDHMCQIEGYPSSVGTQWRRKQRKGHSKSEDYIIRVNHAKPCAVKTGLSKHGRPKKRIKQNISGLRNQKPAENSIPPSPSASNDSGHEDDIPELVTVSQDSRRIDWEKEDGPWEDSDMDDSDAQSEPESDNDDFRKKLVALIEKQDAMDDDLLAVKIKPRDKATSESKNIQQ
jgi:hypothetical protein